MPCEKRWPGKGVDMAREAEKLKESWEWLREEAEEPE